MSQRMKLPVVPFFSNPLLHRFLQDSENRRLFTHVILTRKESDRLELERRFAEHYFEMRFLGFVRKHIHYEAMHLLTKRRALQQQEPLLLNSLIREGEGSTRERLELVEDPHVSVEAEALEKTETLQNVTDNRQLHQALQGLTHKQQTVLYLLYVRQWSEQEVADRLRVSQQAINKIKRSSLIRIRKKLASDPDERPVSQS